MQAAKAARLPPADAPAPRASMQFRTQRPAFADQDLEKRDESHREAAGLLAGHRDQLDALAHALLSAESLNGAEIGHATGLKERPAPEPEVREPVAAGAGEAAAVAL